MKQNIKAGQYANILSLYNINPDYKKAVDQDKVGSRGTFQEYLDDYSDRPNIVESVLTDTIDTETYKYKVSRHRHWMDQVVTITLK